jgi:NAD(P)-dependent dehydrogenase (short-subunit alcohol dehydrogenase family)
VVVGTPDVTDGAALAQWIERFDADHPIDLLIVNAGIFNGHGETAPETVDEVTTILRTNLEGAVLTISAALPMMRARRSGRIAIVGSLAALHPLADAPAYSASKAGVMGYGEALREWLAPDNVAVSLIYPGHMKTAQVAHHVGALPLLMTAEQAARTIKRGLDRGRSTIVFPRAVAVVDSCRSACALALTGAAGIGDALPCRQARGQLQAGGRIAGMPWPDDRRAISR